MSVYLLTLSLFLLLGEELYPKVYLLLLIMSA